MLRNSCLPRFIATFSFALLCAGTLFAAQIDVNLRCVFWKPEIAQEKIYFKNSSYFHVEGAQGFYPLKPQKYRGENPIAIYKKVSDGKFEQCASVEIPAGTQEACVVFFSAKTLPESAAETPYTPTLNVRAFDCSKKMGTGGQLILANLTDATFRASTTGTPAVKVKPGEAETVFSLPKGVGREAVSFKLVSAAKTAEEAKKSWRYGNSISVIETQCYFLVVGPSEVKNPDKPSRYEIISLRDER